MGRLESGEKSVVWLCATAGSGKTRLIDELRRRPGIARHWLLLDEPDAEALQAVFAERGSARATRPRVLLASRPGHDAAKALLAPRLYGDVDVLDERDLFIRPSECRSADERRLFAATGGWPLLVDGYPDRQSEIARLLPAFLDREVLPDLPPRVATALFGCLAGPLSSAAINHLFGAEAMLHPLLGARDGTTTISGGWVREALVVLSTQPKVLRRAGLEELTQLHTRFNEPARAITALVELGLITQAIAVFDAAGGMFFGYRHGYQTLEALLEKFGPDWERRTESLFLARLYLLVKSGRSREALVLLESQYPGLPVDLRRLRLSYRPYPALIRLDLSLDIDDTPPLEVIASWERLGAQLHPGDDMARGILCNTMAIGFAQAGALVQAQELAREALSLYERAGSPYLAHYMLLHLCDLALRHGGLRDASDHVRNAEQALKASAMAFNSEWTVLECFKARIAYEEGRFAECPSEVESVLEALLRGDSWASLMSAMTGQFVFTAFWQQGLRKALDRLDHCALTLSRRHGAARNRDLDLVRIRLYQVARRHEEAGVRLDEYDLDAAGPAAHLEAEERLIRLRQRILQQDGEAALKLAATLAALPSLEARHRITLGILHAYVRLRGGEPGLARRHLRVALRRAEAHGLLGVLVEDGEFLERLLPMFVAKPAPGNTRLIAFAERVARLLRAQASAPLFSKAEAGVTRQEHRVLSYVADQYTNKQIARALHCSESVIKFHLRNLFKKLKVTSRAALCDAVERRGIRT